MSDMFTWITGQQEATKGGPGSGNFGHEGRPGKVGGSAVASGSISPGANLRSKPKKDPQLAFPFAKDYPVPSIQLRYRNAEALRQKVLSHPDLPDDLTEAPQVKEIKSIVNAANQMIEDYARSRQRHGDFSIDDETQRKLATYLSRATALAEQIIPVEDGATEIMHNLLKSDHPFDGKILISPGANDRVPDASEAADIQTHLNQVLDCYDISQRETAPSVIVRPVNVGGTSYYSGKNQKIHMGFPGDAHYPTPGATVIHELGHWIEDHNPQVQRAAERLLLSRLNKSNQAAGYDTIEYHSKHHYQYFKDKWLDPYMGRIYSNRYSGDIDGSELLSSGLDLLFHNPRRLASGDPELFRFTVWALTGLPEE